MLVGNTAREVRSFLRRDERASRLRQRGQQLPPEQLAELLDESLAEISAISRPERDLMPVECPDCNAVGRLCYSETGLPASGPHPQRIDRGKISR